MATDAEVLGIPLELEFQGKIYKIENPIKFDTEARFARWCYNDALNELEQMRVLNKLTNGEEGITEEQFEKSCTRLDTLLAAGEFSWGTALVHNKHSKTWPGIKTILLMRIKKYHPRVTMQLVDDIFKDADAAKRLGNLLNPPEAVVEEETEPQTAETEVTAADN